MPFIGWAGSMKKYVQNNLIIYFSANIFFCTRWRAYDIEPREWKRTKWIKQDNESKQTNKQNRRTRMPNITRKKEALTQMFSKNVGQQKNVLLNIFANKIS